MGQFQRPCTLVALILLVSSLSLNAADFEALTTADGIIVEFAIALPPSFEAGMPAPVMLALPPGPQTKRTFFSVRTNFVRGVNWCRRNL
jgi:hypothetical protein